MEKITTRSVEGHQEVSMSDDHGVDHREHGQDQAPGKKPIERKQTAGGGNPVDGKNQWIAHQ